MKVYYTKYALTSGILIVEGELSERNPGYLSINRLDKMVMQGLLHPGEWFETWEAAVDKAETMRANAIKSAEKKISKLRNMKWVKP